MRRRHRSVIVIEYFESFGSENIISVWSNTYFPQQI
jgi:hypothetical protein